MQGGIHMTQVGPVIMNPEIARKALAPDTEIHVDTETSGLSHKTGKIGVVQLHGKQTGCTAVLHVRGMMPSEVKELLEQPHVTYVGHNSTLFDMQMLAEAGVDVFNQKWYDTLIGEGVVLTSGRAGLRKNLDATAKRRLGHTVKSKIDHGGWMNPVLTEEQIEYSARDVLQLGGIKDKQEQEASGSQADALDFEMKLAPIVARMKYNGVPLSIGHLYTFLRSQYEFRKTMDIKLKSFFNDPNLNLNSNPQVLKHLNRCGFKIESTGAPILKEFVRYGGRNGKLANAILEYRAAATRLKNYRQDWINEHVVNGWVYPNQWQMGTANGRFSSSDPNLQQVPVDMRFVFGNLPGYKIVSGDFSQIEVRVAAWIANDLNLIAKIESGLHIHTALAADMFGVPMDQVTEDQLGMAKNIVFLMIYGGWVNKFFAYVSRTDANLSYDDCVTIFNRFLSDYPGIDAMRRKAQHSAKSNRSVTLFLDTGLRRVLFGKDLSSTRILNSLVQGNATAGLKYSLMECKKQGLEKYLALTVHDELVAVVPDNEADDFAHEMEECMIRGMQNMMPVKTQVKMKVGDTWQK